MFWKRKEKTIHVLGGTIQQIPVPAKKEFETMLELLRDAEKFDTADEKELSLITLSNLSDYVKSYIAKCR